MTTTTTEGRDAPETPAARPPATVTPAATFKAGALYRLPGSGHVVRLRVPSLYSLITVGEVPNPLRDEVTRLLTASGPTKQEDPDARHEITRKNARTFIEIAARCLVEPRLVLDHEPNYSAGEIGPADLHDLDYDWIFFDFARRGADDPEVARFRVA